MNSLQNKTISIVYHIKIGDFNKAEINVKKLIKKYPEIPYLYYLYGTSLDAQNKFDDSIQVYKTAIKLKPDYF